MKWCSQIKKRSEHYSSSKWCFCLVFRREDDKGPVVDLEGWGGMPMTASQSGIPVAASQWHLWDSRRRQWRFGWASPGTLSSETPVAASQWHWASAICGICGLSGTPKPPKVTGCFARGSCFIEAITKDPFEGVLFWGGGPCDGKTWSTSRWGCAPVPGPGPDLETSVFLVFLIQTFKKKRSLLFFEFFEFFNSDNSKN